MPKELVVLLNAYDNYVSMDEGIVCPLLKYDNAKRFVINLCDF